MKWALLHVAVVIALIVAPAAAQDDTLGRALALMRAGDYETAIGLLEAYTRDHPGDGTAWLNLATAYHSVGDYEKSVDVNRRAGQFPHTRPVAKYNEACALSLLDRVEEANRALGEAISAGFLNFDLIEEDPDLNNLRREYDVPMPPRHDYLQFKSGVLLEYKTLLPRGFDSERSYPAVVIFPPGPGPRSADWALSELVTEEDDTGGWIVVYIAGPDGGWFSHPAHHALEELLRRLRSEYDIEGDMFHVAGFGEGARVAATYARMAGDYFQSLTTFTAWHWNRWDDDELVEGFKDFPVHLVVGANDLYGRSQNSRVERLMASGGADVTLTVVEGDDYLLKSIRHGATIEYLPRGAASP